MLNYTSKNTLLSSWIKSFCGFRKIQVKFWGDREGVESDVSGWALSHLTHEEWDRVSYESSYKSHAILFLIIKS